MFIRKTRINSKKDGTSYFTYRLVESRRTETGVKQITLLNLGSHFSLPKEQWPHLVACIQDHLGGQSSFGSYNQDIEEKAVHFASQIVRLTQSREALELKHEKDMKNIDLNSIDLLQPRSIGGEHVALQALQMLGFDQLLKELGFNRHQYHGVIGSIIGRMLSPGSELSTYNWLREQSGLGDLLDYDYESISLQRLYRSADLLYKHKTKIEHHLYETEQSLFQAGDIITLYDLTSTYFEGTCKSNHLAQRGRSKEKRSDCPLVTLALVLGSNGFPKKSKVYKGNASEPETLKEMIAELEHQEQKSNLLKGNGSKSTIVLDAGIATESNVKGLKEQSYPYIVVSRRKHCQFNKEEAVTVKEEGSYVVQIQRVENKENGEVELYCHSTQREKKDQGIQDRFQNIFEESLKDLKKGLNKKYCVKNYEKVLIKIGRLKEKYSKAAKHYDVTVEKDRDSENAKDIRWTRKWSPNDPANHPGVYCIRSSHLDWEAKELWKTYIMLTDLESVFRSLKSELGFRPVYHQNADRTGSHLFITLLAFHFVQAIRTQLKAHGEAKSWNQLRKQLLQHERITVRMQTDDGKTIHMRKPNEATPEQKKIYALLGLSPFPGGRTKAVFKRRKHL